MKLQTLNQQIQETHCEFDHLKRKCRSRFGIGRSEIHANICKRRNSAESPGMGRVLIIIPYLKRKKFAKKSGDWIESKRHKYGATMVIG